MEKTPESPLETLQRLQRQHAEKARAEGRATVTPINQRLIASSVQIAARLPDDILFQHTVFCQTVLPYRDPGPEVRIWERQQGNVSLSLEAGRTKDPQGQFVPVGLPFGAAARLILCHLNTEALRTGSPVIEIAGSMTAFVARLQGFGPNGAQIRKFKDQSIRLSAALVRLAVDREGHAVQVDTKIINAFELWVERFDQERFLSPNKDPVGRGLLRQPARARHPARRTGGRRPGPFRHGAGWVLLAGATPASGGPQAGPVRPLGGPAPAVRAGLRAHQGFSARFPCDAESGQNPISRRPVRR